MRFTTPLSPIIYAKLLGSKMASDYQPKITATGILKGDGSGNVSAAVAGTDYLGPDAIEEVKGTITDWLDEHVDPDTGYVIDNSLTIRGAAADAKATGDSITDLKDRALTEREITVSASYIASHPEFIDFNNFPVNSVVRVYANARKLINPETQEATSINQALDNAPPCLTTVGHVSSSEQSYKAVNRGYPAVVETFKSNIGNDVYIVQICHGRNEDDNNPIEFVAERFKKGNVWSSWNRLSSDTMIHGTNKVVDRYTCSQFTFTDFNDAPVNTIYQVDKNVRAEDVAHNPVPGKSGVLMTFAFSATTRHAIVQMYFALSVESSVADDCVFEMFFRYGFERSSTSYIWTNWNKVSTTTVQ